MTQWSDDKQWWWDGQKWRPAAEYQPQPPQPKKAEGIDLRSWLWPIAGVGIGLLSLWELLFSTSHTWHPLAPIAGLILSAITVITAIVVGGAARLALGVFAIVGLVTNAIALVLVVTNVAGG